MNRTIEGHFLFGFFLPFSLAPGTQHFFKVQMPFGRAQIPLSDAIFVAAPWKKFE